MAKIDSQEFFGALPRIHRINSAEGRAGDDVCRALLAEGVSSVGAAAGGIFVVDEAGANLELTVAVNYPEPLADRYRLIPLVAQVPLVDTVRTTTPIFLGSLEDFVARYPEYARAHPEIARNGFASLPLLLDGHCAGAVVLGFGHPFDFTAEVRAFVIALAYQCASVLERSRRLDADQDLRRSAERVSQRVERLHGFTSALAQAITPAEVIEAVVDLGIVATTARSGALWLLAADGASVVLSRSAGSFEPAADALARVSAESPSRTPVLAAIRGGAAVWIESRSQLEERYPDLLAERAHTGEGSLVCLPLFAQGRCIGGLMYGFGGIHRFREDERAFLQVVAWYSAQALERARLYQEACDADRQKDEFLAMLSHELRNPLAPILTALELMDLRGETSFARERAMISRHVRHVVRLVDDLLDVSRITRGKVQLERRDCELASIIAGAVEMASPLVTQRAHRLSVSVPERGLQVSADQLRLTQVVANLLTNAAKYTEPGGTVAISAQAEGHDAVIRVRDSGAGIAPELLPRVFDLFVQGSSALDRSQGGLGVGLTVVKKVVNLHGGSVSAHSAGLGHGSEFVIRLPCIE